MNKYSQHSKYSGMTAVILGITLLVGIVLATINLLSTYKVIHAQKQATIWNILQLDRQIARTLFDSQQYINNYKSTEQLRHSYKALQSRFPVTKAGLEEDAIFQKVTGLSRSIDATDIHVTSAEAMMLNSETTDPIELNQWLNMLNGMKKQINDEILDHVASMKSEYSDKAFSVIIKNAAILLVLIFTFILYLTYLLAALQKQRKRNLYMLAHDALTGLNSRDFAMTTLQSYCDKKTPFALLMFDLNKFKTVNDTYGHHAGDQLLIHLADKFKQTLCKHGIVGRLGGDEFVWLADSDDPAVIKEQYASFLKELTAPCVINDLRLFLHISAGGGIAADYEFHKTQLLERVDEAMYQAKSLQIKEIFWENKATFELLNPDQRHEPKKDDEAIEYYL